MTINDKPVKCPAWRKYLNGIIAAEISAQVTYYDRLIQWQSRDGDTGLLLELIQCPAKSRLSKGEEFPDLRAEKDQRTAVLLNGNLNHHFDIQEMLGTLRSRLARTSRLILVLYNPYLRAVYRLANWLGVRQGELPTTFITETDLRNLARLSGFEVVRSRPAAYVPWRIFGLGSALNCILPVIPGVRNLGLVQIVTFRPCAAREAGKPSLSVIIPARNERGNIEDAVKRLPDLGCAVEAIFIEGHSTDGTWEEIERVTREYDGKGIR